MNIKTFFPGTPRALGMVGLAFLAQDLGLGIVMASYPAMIPGIEAAFGANRVLSSLGIAILSVVVGLMGPVVGLLLRRIEVRTVLVSGACICVCAHLLLSTTQNIMVFLFVFATVVSFGTGLMGIYAPTTLVSRWYSTGRARALGFVVMPLYLVWVPPVAAWVITGYGLKAWILCMAGLYLLLVPMMMLVIDSPEKVGETATGADDHPEDAEKKITLKLSAVARDPRFWLLTIGVGLISSSASGFVNHSIAFAGTKGISVQSASVLVTAFGVAGIFGNLIFCSIADRVGAAKMLVVNALGQMCVWAILPVMTGLPMLIVLAGVLGMVTTSLIALHAAMVNELYGHRNVSAILGFGYMFKIPFLFTATPFAGYMYDVTGNYLAAFLVFVGVTAVAGLCFILLILIQKKRPPSLSGANTVPYDAGSNQLSSQSTS